MTRRKFLVKLCHKSFERWKNVSEIVWGNIRMVLVKKIHSGTKSNLNGHDITTFWPLKA